MRFLVVDDSQTMRRIIINTLSKLGHTDVAEAANGREGLVELQKQGVDLVITDWNMPEMNGLEFTKAIRARDAGTRTRILMVTTNTSQGDVVEAVQAGVDSYVAKPFTPQALQEKIAAIFESKA